MDKYAFHKARATWVGELVARGTVESNRSDTILVLEDIEETRDLIERMLKLDGYDVTLARSEEDAIAEGLLRTPRLVLISLGLELDQLLATARRIRHRVALGHEVAIVIFCVSTIPQGAEMEVQTNVYLTRPDNFNQLRELFYRLLRR